MERLFLFVFVVVAIDYLFGRQSRQLPGTPAAEWKQWLAFVFCLISTYATIYFSRNS